jgi:hypothetical protein
MDLASLQKFVKEHPEGVLIRMVDGTKYRVPHRDYITLGPPSEERSPRSPHRTSFLVWDGDGHALVNALLVADVSPLKKGNGHNGNGKSGSGGRGKKK